MAGYMVSADNEKVILLTQEGRVKFRIAPENFQEVGVEHLASHAGLVDIGFAVTYEERNGRRYIRGAQEIPPPFPYPQDEGS